MYNLIEYSDNCSKTSGSLWQYYRDEPNDNLTDSELFKSKLEIARALLMKNTWKTLEIHLKPMK